MNEIVFLPKYGIYYLVRVLFFGVLTLPELISAIRARDVITFVVFSGIAVLVLGVMVLVYIRQIKFLDKSFTIVRFILPPKTIEYASVIEVGHGGIKVRDWGKIYLYGMQNSDELLRRMNDFVGERPVQA